MYNKSVNDGGQKSVAEVAAVAIIAHETDLSNISSPYSHAVNTLSTVRAQQQQQQASKYWW